MDLAPLRHRDFRLLYIAQFVSLLGTMITYVALPYQMYRLTGSSLSVGLLGLAELVSLLATAFLGGMLADVVDRRRMAIATDIGLAAGSAALALLAMTGASPWSLYLVAAWMSGVSGLQRPSIESLSPRLVPHDELPAAGSLATSHANSPEEGSSSAIPWMRCAASGCSCSATRENSFVTIAWNAPPGGAEPR